MVRLSKSIAFHLFPALALLLVVAALAGYPHWQVAAGIAIGSLLLDIDHWLFIFIAAPNEAISQAVRQRLSTGSYITAIDYMVAHRREFRRLPLHSVAFQLCLAVTALFSAIQSPNSLVAGIMAGLFLHTVVDQAGDLNRTGHLHHWFWVTGRQAPIAMQKAYYALTIVVLSLLLLLIFA